jgi:hypothetical protein
LFQGLLGRPADQQGEQYWSTKLKAGESRTDVALGFTSSIERERQRIAANYLHCLGRAADQQGLGYWTEKFAVGVTNEDLITGFVAASEYFKQHTRADLSNLSAALAIFMNRLRKHQPAPFFEFDLPAAARDLAPHPAGRRMAITGFDSVLRRSVSEGSPEPIPPQYSVAVCRACCGLGYIPVKQPRQAADDFRMLLGGIPRFADVGR